MARSQNIHAQSGRENNPDGISQYASTAPARINLALAGNPFGPSPTIKERYAAVAEELGHRNGDYPHIARHLEAKIRARHEITPDEVGSENKMSPDVYLGNGCTGIIQDIFNSGLIKQGEYLVVPESTFPVPANLAIQNSIAVNKVSLTNDLKIDFGQISRAVEKTTARGYKVSMIFLANPNNPTGYAQTTKSIIEMAMACPESLVVVSEANIDYVSETALKRMGGTLLDRENIDQLPKNILVLRSFSKAYGLADDRVGYAIGDRALLAALRQRIAPFNMSAHSLIDAIIALDDNDHVVKSREHMEREIKKFAERFKSLGFPNTTESDSNLLIARVPSYFSSSDELVSLLRDQNCAVVSCGAEFGEQLKGKYIRVTPASADQNDEFLDILQKICTDKEEKYLAAQHNDKPVGLTLSEILRGNGKRNCSVDNRCTNEGLHSLTH